MSNPDYPGWMIVYGCQVRDAVSGRWLGAAKVYRYDPADGVDKVFGDLASGRTVGTVYPHAIFVREFVGEATKNGEYNWHTAAESFAAAAAFVAAE